MRKTLLVLTMVLVSAQPAAANEGDSGAGETALTCLGEVVTIMGTPGRDVIEGTSGDDVIHGGGGRDIIRGRGGDDIICGGDGRDRVVGGPGADIIVGGQGEDVLIGGSGSDVLDAHDDLGLLRGGPGEDTCIGGRTQRSCESGPPMVRPVDAPVTSYYGWRWHPIYQRWMVHHGWDFDAACGDPITAPGTGTITWSGWMDDRTGNAIRIDHGEGLASSYAHLSEVLVSVGESVDAGAVIGVVGTTGASTGCHLHFGMKQDGRWIDPTPSMCPAVGAPSVPLDRDGCPDGE